MLSFASPPGATSNWVREGSASCPPVVLGAVVYGPNASGKSNLVRSISTAVRLVVRGVGIDEELAVPGFNLDPALAAGAPSRFQFDLALDDRTYVYGLAVDGRGVDEEWLLEGEALVFRRERGRDAELGPVVPADERPRWQLVLESTRSEQLFVREGENYQLPLLSRIARWFREDVVVVVPWSRYRPLVRRVTEEGSFREALVDLLRRADTGITGVTLHAEPVPDDVDTTTFETVSVQLGAWVDRKEKMLRRFAMTHAGVDGDHTLALDTESDGTRRLMDLLPLTLRPRERPSLLIVDELERSLHPLLSRALVRELRKECIATGSQLLFTTHATHLLEEDVTGQDVAWMCEKSAVGATTLTPLSDFNPEQMAQLRPTLERAYLDGRFGAIPRLRARQS